VVIQEALLRRLVYGVIAFIGIVGMEAPAKAGGFDPMRILRITRWLSARFPFF